MPAKSSTTSKKSAPKQKKKSTPKTTSKAAAAVEPVSVAVAPVAPVAPVVPVVPVAEPVEPVSETSSLDGIESEFISLATRLQELRTLQMSISSDLKKLQKTVHKHVKESSKKQKKKRNMDPNRVKREPSGFAKPALISTQLCSFLGKPEGTEMARTEVTKYLTQYIKKHNLQDEANRRKILPDQPLQKLLNVGKGDEVTYFNLQKYMKVHFPKPAVSA
jgi:upstream activation factor subunit UAF30